MDTEAELEEMSKKVHDEEEDLYANYEEGIFIFNKQSSNFLGC